MFDVIVIGAGIIGCCIAKDLSKYELNVLVLEKASDVSTGASMANSAIIHSGHDPLDNTLKAKLNIEGNRMYEKLCEELNCDYKKIGAYVLATNEEEMRQLEVLYKRAQSRDIPSFIHERDEICKNEPNISKNVIQGLYLPTTGLITPWEVAIKCMENAINNGVELKLREEVIDIEKGECFIIRTRQHEYQTKAIINATGVVADDIAKLVDPSSSLSITARKGEYLVLDRLEKPLVNHILYPIPSSKGKGVLVVPTIHNNTLLGPTSVEISDKMANNNTIDGLRYVKDEVGKLVDSIPFDKVIRTFAGNRPSGNTHDFVVEESKNVENFYNVAAIESPGLASAPAISKMIVDLYCTKNNVKEKEQYNQRCPKYLVINELSDDEKNKLVQENSNYGRIVCRCEKITEAEIVEAIHRPCPATSINAIKRRVRPGSGRCQGGFCEPLVLDIIARELNVEKDTVKLENELSDILLERTKNYEKV